MKNIILGSGLIGLLAKLILPDDFILIPFGYSRFYRYAVPLNDDFIYVNSKISEYFQPLGIQPSTEMRRTAFSYNGSLFAGTDQNLMSMWLNKTTNGDFPSYAPGVMAADTRFIYNKSSSEIYKMLLMRNKEKIETGIKYGKATAIDTKNRTITFDTGTKIDYDLAVSCIPLDILSNLCSVRTEIASIPCHFLHLISDTIDLEGNDRALVVDSFLDFFRVDKVDKNGYVFHFKSKVDDYGMYLLPIIGTADIIQATTISNFMPIGDPPNLSEFEKHDIYPVGQSAQHDLALDICSTILRIDKLKETWFEKRWGRKL